MPCARDGKGAAGYGVLLTVGLWLCLLVWCATQIVYGDRRALSSQKSALDTEVQRLSTENTGLITERDKLKTDNDRLKRNPSRTQPAQEAEQRCWLSNFFGMPTSTVKGAVTASAAVIHCNKKIDAPFEVAVEFDKDFLPGAMTLPDSGVVMGSGEDKQGKIYVGRINNPPLLSDQLIVVTVYGRSTSIPAHCTQGCKLSNSSINVLVLSAKGGCQGITSKSISRLVPRFG